MLLRRCKMGGAEAGSLSVMMLARTQGRAELPAGAIDMLWEFVERVQGAPTEWPWNKVVDHLPFEDLDNDTFSGACCVPRNAPAGVSDPFARAQSSTPSEGRTGEARTATTRTGACTLAGARTMPMWVLHFAFLRCVCVRSWGLHLTLLFVPSLLSFLSRC